MSSRPLVPFQSSRTSLTCHATASIYSAVTQPPKTSLATNVCDATGSTIAQSRKAELQPSANGELDDVNTSPQNSSLPNFGDGAAGPMVEPQTSSLHNEIDGIDGAADAKAGDQLQVMCGPLLNYQGMTEEGTETFWHGSVLLVVEPGRQVPHLELRKHGRTGQTDALKTTGFFSGVEKSISVEGLKLYADPIKTFWRFTVRIPLDAAEITWEYTIPNMHFRSEVSTSPSREFVVPATSQSMRLMFHSCNGFSVGTDEDYWSGEANRVC